MTRKVAVKPMKVNRTAKPGVTKLAMGVALHNCPHCKGSFTVDKKSGRRRKL